MSEWKFEFGVSTCYMGSDVRETFDLIDDLGFEEDELKGKSDSEILDMLASEMENFISNNTDSWVIRV